MPSMAAFEDAEGSDNWGAGFLAAMVQLFVWMCVGVAILIALALLLHWIGRRRVAERDIDDLW
jgi:hypothetical protein